MQKLTDEQQEFIIQQLACFKTPTQVAALIKSKYELEISPQRIEYYDPTKRSDRKRLAPEHKLLFDETRKQYIADTAAVGVAHQRYRLELLQGMIEDVLSKKNYQMVSNLLVQAAKEAGGHYNARKQDSDSQSGQHAATKVNEILNEYAESFPAKASEDLTPTTNSDETTKH